MRRVGSTIFDRSELNSGIETVRFDPSPPSPRVTRVKPNLARAHRRVLHLPAAASFCVERRCCFFCKIFFVAPLAFASFYIHAKKQKNDCDFSAWSLHHDEPFSPPHPKHFRKWHWFQSPPETFFKVLFYPPPHAYTMYIVAGGHFF